MKVRDGIAIVTGAASGIGEAVSILLAKRGATVVGVDVREEALTASIERCRRLAPGSIPRVADVASRAACEETIAAVEALFGRIDVLINNAAIGCHKHASETTADDVARVMAVNFFGPVYLTTAVLPGMLQRRRGSIVNVTSVAGYLPNPRESAYSASKAALSMWSHGMNVDLYGTGVHVGVLSPGPMDTGLWSTLETPSAYHGKLQPPTVAAEAVVGLIERESTHATVPRRYGALGALYPMLGRPMRWGLRAFDRRGSGD